MIDIVCEDCVIEDGAINVAKIFRLVLKILEL